MAHSSYCFSLRLRRLRMGRYRRLVPEIGTDLRFGHPFVKFHFKNDAQKTESST